MHVVDSLDKDMSKSFMLTLDGPWLALQDDVFLLVTTSCNVTRGQLRLPSWISKCKVNKIDGKLMQNNNEF